MPVVVVVVVLLVVGQEVLEGAALEVTQQLQPQASQEQQILEAAVAEAV
jgi:hypothetical protein